MKAERLAEIRKFAVETIPDILKQKREPQTERALFSTGPALLELIDALTAERARAEQADIHDHLISTEPLYAWANKRIEMLEEENKRIKELEAEVARLASLKSSPGCCDKAAKYDSVCEQFPYMPGEEFYGSLSKKTLVLKAGDPVPELKIYRRTVDLFGEKGVIDTNGNSWTWDEMHPTADACRAAIPVEE